MAKYEMVATTQTGLEGVLAKEIVKLGGVNVTELKRAVRFFGDDELLYKANIALRTALRILVPLEEFKAHDEQELYRKMYALPWEDIFEVNQTFAIDTVVNGFIFKHSKYVALKSKDAIVDRFRNQFDIRPSVNTENPDIQIHIHVVDDRITVSLDSSGLSLDKRGYRKTANEAPINEVLAAGLLQLSEWDGSKPLYDPMSGSGTFGIEAALIATRTAPGLKRSFSFQNWLEYDAELFSKVKAELESKVIEADVKIFSRDIMNKNIDIISQNAMDAEMEDYLSLKKEDFFESEPKTPTGVILINPPYGERLRMVNIESFYKRIGDTLKQKYANFDCWIISSDFDALKAIGLKSSFRLDLMNGGLKARLLKFEMYKGRKED